MVKYKKFLFFFIAGLLSASIGGCSNEAVSYDPIVSDDFFFNEPGEQRVYTFTPIKSSVMEIALYSNGYDLPYSLLEKLPFKWKVKAEVFRNRKKIESFYLTAKAGWPQKETLEYFKVISLGVFKSFSNETHPSPVTVKLSVEKVDPRFARANKSLSIGFRASPIP